MANDRDYTVTSCTGVELGAMDPEMAARKSSMYLPKRLSFKDRFSHILTGFTWEEPEPVQDCSIYDTDQQERENWWEAVQKTILGNPDLLERVKGKCKEPATDQWRKTVQEVLTDVMLEMEELGPSEALVYIFEQEFSFFPTHFLLQELLSREADLFSESRVKDTTAHALRLAVRSGQVQLVSEFANSALLHTFTSVYNDYPLLHEAAATGNVDMYSLLVETGANEKVRDKENRTIMHVVAEHNCEKLGLRLVDEEKAELVTQDNNGWTPLHQAVFSKSVAVSELLLQKGSPVNLQDVNGQTPLHIAVEKKSMNMMKLLLDHKANAGIADHNNETPLNLALALRWQVGCQYLMNHCHKGEGSKVLRKALKQAMKGRKDQLAAEKIRELPPSEVEKMLQHELSFINDFVDNPSMKKSTLAILDHFVLANTCINTEVMESDPKGYPPDSKFFDPKSKTFLAAVSHRDAKDIALHPAVKVLMDHKWNAFGWRLFGFLFTLYSIRMLMFGAALFIAARPGLDNPGCYRNGWDYARGVFEGISLIIFLVKGYDEIRRMFQIKRAYFRSYFHTLQIVSVVLPLLIIPFRAATTWCASTGEGHCALPVNTTPMRNTTAMGNTSVSESCLVASSVQWIVASLAYFANALRIVEYVAVFRITGAYWRILWMILNKDIIKWTLIFFVVLHIFVGSFYLALRAGVVISADGQIRSDLQLFQLQTLYPWHVLFTGFRILFEAESVLHSYFAVDEATGQYIGYQWFSIVMYLVFLFMVIVVLLNLLIAQMSSTYCNIQDEAEGTYAVARARMLARLENYDPLFNCGKPFRKAYYKKFLWTYEITDKKEDKHDEKLISMEKKVDSLEKKMDFLGKKMDSLAKMMTEIIDNHQVERPQQTRSH